MGPLHSGETWCVTVSTVLTPASERMKCLVGVLLYRPPLGGERTPGAAPRVHGLEAGHHHPGCRPPSPTGPWDKPTVEEAVDSGPTTVSRRYLSSLKNKLSSRDWRKSCQARTCPGPGTQEPEEKRIVQELLETEQAYVARLHLLDQVFFQELLKEARSSKAFPEDVVRLIFSNTASIYQFHAQFFLPELQQRLDDWTTTPRIGDVIQKLAPFLKMYSEYVKNFERAAELLATWSDKSPPFQEVITRIQSSEASGSLTLQHHMLEPVQRIPRYELLLKEYVQKLPAQAPDLADAQKALDMIFSAAQHSNAAITEMERLQELWEVYQRLGLEDDLVDPSNTLLREGPVLKISFRRVGPMERYLFLFNNMLLYCVPRVIQVGAQFQVRTRIDVASMKLQSEELGLRAPQWVRDKMVTMCMRCQEPFNALMRRRHHCRACGYVVCARCSDYRAELKYDDNRPSRVCLDCYTFLTGNVLPEDKEDKRRGILEKGAAAGSEQSLMCSFLQLLGDKWGKSGSRGWCVIPRDDPLVLYVYAAPQPSEAVAPNGRTAAHSSALPSQDMRAHTSIPLLGYQVTAGPQADPRVFQLQQSGQLYTFKAETEELKDRWVKAMERAASGLSPGGPNDRDLSD
ncbi:FYVE, RhoGEF and PH domain-containing protein 2 isoform X10 [Neophocaena asiaeorientalis asiaeorientalis]|uniref:FYVE, RhoGEF and PH domain-containing protein 2 isoform X10 n=1 Tax=Neophocaena asiaeorientalis asiaeorientalis TaxID=1706337 RepID=A0A341D3R1_NEOAA|nr:FYVE, RhoGEF and PH domain-containing protein 2 isoform X10 [Neophocaena asiaeorientalis asiaeorientalis]